MITLFIVDDEKITRDSLQEFIPWRELGIELVKTAKHGLAALELAALLKPDIVLTDVRMPKMDGIEFSKKLKEIYPDCKIIFISGYSDKEYLKSAIHLGAVSYIEKPLNFDEIISVVRETVALCREEEKKRADEISIRSSLNESLPLIHQKITLELINDNANIKMLKESFRVPFLEMPANSKFTVICIVLNWKFGLNACKKNEDKKCILNQLSGCDAGLPMPSTAGFVEDDHLVFIAPGDIGSSDTTPNNLLDGITGSSNNDFTTSAGVGCAAATMQGIPESYRSALISVKMQFYEGHGKVFYRNHWIQGKFIPDKNLTAVFREALKNDRQEAALQLIRNFTQDVLASRNGDIESIKNSYFNLLLLVFEAAREKNLIDFADKNEQCYIWQEIDRIRFLSELSDYLQNNIRVIFSQPGQDDTVKKKVHEINRYIRENISNNELSIQAIAQNFFLNQQYICSYYKKMTGKTLNDYMTDVRIEKAKELLKDRRIKLYDVASRIGLTDPNYFSTLFKKYTGSTPSEFREKS